MIKSKFTFTGLFLIWYLFAISPLIVYLYLSAIAHLLGYSTVSLDNGKAWFITVTSSFLIILLFGQLKINAKTICIDPLSQTIKITNYFTRFSRVYSFADFDGYVDSLVKSPKGDFRVLYLVQDKRLTTKIAGRVFRNIDEMENGLKSLKYLGFQKYSLALSFKIFFRKSIL